MLQKKALQVKNPTKKQLVEKVDALQVMLQIAQANATEKGAASYLVTAAAIMALRSAAPLQDLPRARSTLVVNFQSNPQAAFARRSIAISAR